MTSIARDEDANPAAEGLRILDQQHAFGCPCEPCMERYESEGLVLWTKEIAEAERLRHLNDVVKPDTDPLFLAADRKAEEG